MSFPDIRTLLPHRPPMLWLDAVLAHEADEVRCGLTLRDDHVFVARGEAEGVVAIEWIAQAVGALVGLRDHARSVVPRPGYLIAIPQAELFVDAFRVGDVVEVTARHTWGDDTLGSFEGEVRHGDTLAARAQLSVYRKPLSGSLDA